MSNIQNAQEDLKNKDLETQNFQDLQENKQNENNKSQEEKTQKISKKKKIIIVIVVILVILCIIGYFTYNYFIYGNVLPQTYSDSDPVYNGYDVVEYHSLQADQNGVKGEKQFQYVYDNAVFWFKNEENLNKFKGNTGKYAPQIGGFCTWGLQNPGGSPWNKDWLGPGCDVVRGWTIYKGKLYCNYSESLAQEFFEESNAEQNLKEVQDLWRKWFGSLDAKAGYFNNRCYTANYRYCVVNQVDFGQGQY